MKNEVISQTGRSCCCFLMQTVWICASVAVSDFIFLWSLEIKDSQCSSFTLRHSQHTVNTNSNVKSPWSSLCGADLHKASRVKGRGWRQAEVRSSAADWEFSFFWLSLWFCVCCAVCWGKGVCWNRGNSSWGRAAWWFFTTSDFDLTVTWKSQ